MKLLPGFCGRFGGIVRRCGEVGCHFYVLQVAVCGCGFPFGCMAVGQVPVSVMALA